MDNIFGGKYSAPNGPVIATSEASQSMLGSSEADAGNSSSDAGSSTELAPSPSALQEGASKPRAKRRRRSVSEGEDEYLSFLRETEEANRKRLVRMEEREERMVGYMSVIAESLQTLVARVANHPVQPPPLLQPH